MVGRLLERDATPDPPNAAVVATTDGNSFITTQLLAATADAPGDGGPPPGLSEAEDVRWLSRLLQPLGRPTEAMQAAHASLRLLEDLGPSPQLAWSLIGMAHIAALSLDPACARYAARAKTLGTQFQDPAVVIRARGYAALTTVFCSDTGWDEFEAVWREAAATPGWRNTAKSWASSSAFSLSFAANSVARSITSSKQRPSSTTTT